MFFKQKSVVEKVVGIAAPGLLGGVLLSWPLWNDTARAAFPLLPLFGEASLKKSDGWQALFQPIFTVAAIFCVGIFSSKKWPLALLAVWMLWLCALDINRLQPWVWFYLLIFAIVFLGKKENETSTTHTLRWLLAAVYFWGGFSKLTPYFAEDNFAWFCEAFDFTQPLARFPLIGYAIAFLEMTFAVGFLWDKTRSYFRWIIIGFHALIIVFLLKLNWNWVVVPWNLGMAAMVWALAKNSEETAVNPSQKGIVAFIWLTPALAYFQLLPQNLAWQLYSNTQPEATFFSQNSPPCASFSKIWGKHAFDGGTKLLLDDWANDELRVPMFASERTFRQVGQYLCACSANPDSAGLYILKVNRWNKSAEKMEKIPCRALLTE